MTYDAMNRMLSLDDTRPMDAVDSTDDMRLTIAYEYNANGNVRRVDTQYRDVDAATRTGDKDQWYLYDSMNRMVLGKGTMSGGIITRGEFGVELAYDAAGQRTLAITTNSAGYAHREQYSYTPDGFLDGVYMADGMALDPDPDASDVTQRVIERHDALGRVVYHEEKSHDALGVLQMINVRKVQYSALSLAEKDQVFVLQDNGFFNRTTSLYEYGAFNVATGDYDGQYQGGGATRIFGETHKLETQPAFKYDSTTINQYDWWEGARQWLINTVPTGDAPHQSSSSGTMYDFNGRVRDWRIDDINARRIDYTVNANGQVMERNEVSVDEDVPDGPRPRQLFYYFNGMQVGDVGNKGALDVDYAETIRRRTADQRPDGGRHRLKTPPLAFAAEALRWRHAAFAETTGRMTDPEAQTPPPAGKPALGPVKRWLLRSLGVVMVGLATAGAFLPLLPTTPFLLVALWAFTASAPEWAERLRRHPRFGPMLVAWEERRAIPRPAKAAAGVAMGASWTGLALTYHNLWVVGGVGALFVAVFAYVVTRPSR